MSAATGTLGQKPPGPGARRAPRTAEELRRGKKSHSPQGREPAPARSAALLQRRGIQFVLCSGAIDGVREIRHQSSEASQFSLETLYSLFGQGPPHVV